MVGESIGSFEIVSQLGQGGMGVVYLAQHKRIARKVAIKVLLPQLSHDPEIVERFFTEARATSMIRHPGLVEISDCDVLPNGSAYIVMELLEGESLGNHLASQGRLPVARALIAARNIADALAAAHAQNIVHRDLKPDNVFLMPPTAGSPAPIKILDFGIAKLMDAGGGHKTRTGILLGTPVYMSPEQCRGASTVDHRTDIYAFGCLLYEMLVGHPPFRGEGFGELIQAHLMVTPERLRALDPTIPPALDDLVARMLAKSPDERPQTMRQLVRELDALAGNPGTGAQTPVPVKDPPSAPFGGIGATMRLPASAPRRASPVETTLGSSTWETVPAVKTRSSGGIWAAVLTVVIVGGGFGLWQATRHDPAAPERATTAATPAPPAPPPSPERVERVVEAPPAPEPTPPPVAPEPERSRPTVSPSVPSPAPSPAPSSSHDRKVKVMITSEPSGADVCLASTRALVGRTNLSFSANKGGRATQLLIRKRGYRGQEITVSAEREPTKVKLDKLGPDDMEDIDNCEKR